MLMPRQPVPTLHVPTLAHGYFKLAEDAAPCGCDACASAISADAESELSACHDCARKCRRS